MAGFSLHPLLPALKIRVTAIHQHGDKLYVGLANGSLQIYDFDLSSPSSSKNGPLPHVTLRKTHTLARKPIDQIGVLPLTNQLVLLCDSSITLHSLPDLKAPAKPLAQSRYAHAFAITTYAAPFAKKRSQSTFSGGAPVVGPVKDDNEGAGATKREVRELLVVGCRKKVVVFGAGKGGLKDAWELNLPHSPRCVIIPSTPSSSSSSTTPLPESVHLLYTPQTSAILNIHPSSTQRLSVSEITAAPPPPVADGGATSAGSAQGGQPDGGGGSGLSVGMGALSGLGGYVGLGGKAAVPVGTRTVGGEVLIARDDVGVLYSSEGNFTRRESLQWPGAPEAIAFSNPFIYSLVPVVPPSSATTTTPSAAPSSAIQVHLGPTLALRQTLAVPSPSTGGLAVTASAVLTPTNATPAESMAPAAKLVFASTPTDKTLSQAEGSSIWAVQAGDLGEEVDELVREGRVADAIGMVEAVGDSGLSPSRRLPHLRILHAVQQFSRGSYQQAIETFLVFNVNPALVISLYPQSTISGRLHVAKDGWMSLFGAVEAARMEPDTGATGMQKDGEEVGGVRGLVGRMGHLGLSKKPSIDTISAKAKDGDDASVQSADKGEIVPPVGSGDDHVTPRAALEALMYFLSDRRQKLTGAIAALPPSSPLPAESSLPALSTLSAEELHALPSVPTTDLEPDQLLRMAQVIYTALIKVYLVARPILVGSLCRIENWCDVEEVEGLLKAQKKFGDLIDLYQGKKMHAKALGMLHELAKDEEDRLDRYPPTVRYLQKLGPSELPLILETSKWIFAEDASMGLQIFTADEPEVEALPRTEIVQFLSKENEGACAGYLEHIIRELGEEGAEFHDKLVEIYLAEANKAIKGSKDGERPEAYSELLMFLETSKDYRAHRLISKLSSNEMPEARAIFLGRMGKHEEALRIYVFQLHDYASAESYCSREYATAPDPHGIFLLLLRIYLLTPTTPSSNEKEETRPLLGPALALIAKHGTKLDAQAVMDLLPPLVSVEEIKAFLVRTMREGQSQRNMERVVRSLVGARKEQVERGLMGLQVKRVRITDQRICPQCSKRIGGSAIAVHAPRGEVTHLHCKDAFSDRLAKIRA